jgi:hypothetical protein
MKPYAAMSAYTERLLRFSRLATDFSVRVLRGVAWPKVELVIRLWLAQILLKIRMGRCAGVPAGFAR